VVGGRGPSGPQEARQRVGLVAEVFDRPGVGRTGGFGRASTLRAAFESRDRCSRVGAVDQADVTAVPQVEGVEEQAAQRMRDAGLAGPGIGDHLLRPAQR